MQYHDCLSCNWTLTLEGKAKLKEQATRRLQCKVRDHQTELSQYVFISLKKIDGGSTGEKRQ